MTEHNLNQLVTAGFAVLTISDSRNARTDKSGETAKKLIEEKGHKVLTYEIVKNDKLQIQTTVREMLQNPNVKVIITIGGTGISRRDLTVEAVSKLLDKKIMGFGELFRNLSFQEIGETAIISRATAGTTNGKIVFCLPGSENAVRLALDKLILPKLGHIIKEANR